MITRRRIEITAFRQQVMVVYGDPGGPTAEEADNSTVIKDLETSEPTRPDSAEGKRIMAEAIDVLRNYLDNVPK